MKKVSIILIFSFIVLTLLFSGCTTGEGDWPFTATPVTPIPTPSPTPDQSYLGMHLECVETPGTSLGAGCIPVANTVLNQANMCSNSKECTHGQCDYKECVQEINRPFTYNDGWIVDQPDECITDDGCFYKRCTTTTTAGLHYCQELPNTRHDEYGMIIDERDDCQTKADCECGMHQPPGNYAWPGDPESNYFEMCYGHGCTDSQECKICPTDTENCTCLEICGNQITKDNVITDKDEASAMCAGADLSCNCLPGQEPLYCVPVIIGVDPPHYGCMCGPQQGQ